MGFQHNKNRPKTDKPLSFEKFCIKKLGMPRWEVPTKKDIVEAIHHLGINHAQRTSALVESIAIHQPVWEEMPSGMIGSIYPAADHADATIFLIGAFNAGRALFFDEHFQKIKDKGEIVIIDNEPTFLFKKIIEDQIKVLSTPKEHYVANPKPKFKFQKQLTRGKHNGQYNR
jgi:hypothetical protein